MKTLYAGAGIAAAAGLLLGAIAKPDLRGDERPEGPQILAGVGGPRAPAPVDDGQGFARYGPRPPDYVLGTDWQKAVAAPPYAFAEPPAEEAWAVEEPALEPGPLLHAAHADRARPKPRYPSMEGGELYGADLLPPARPGDEAEDPSALG